MTDDTVTISRKEYEELKKRDRLLTAMEWAGVDNWEDGGMVQEYLTRWDDEDRESATPELKP